MERQRPTSGRKRIEDIQRTQKRLSEEADNNRGILGILWQVNPEPRGTIKRVQERQSAVYNSINRNRQELHILWSVELGGGD